MFAPFLILCVSLPSVVQSVVFDESSCGATFDNVGVLEMNGPVVCPDNGDGNPAVTLIGATTFDLMGHQLSVSNQREVVHATGQGTVVRNGSLQGAGTTGNPLPPLVWWSASDGLVEDLTLQLAPFGIIVSDDAFANRDEGSNTIFRNLDFLNTAEEALLVRGVDCTFNDIRISNTDPQRNAVTVRGNRNMFQDFVITNPGTAVSVQGMDVEMRNFVITQFSGIGLEVTDTAENGYYDGFQISNPKANAANTLLVDLKGTNQTVVNADVSTTTGGCVIIGGKFFVIPSVITIDETADALRFLDSRVNCPADVSCLTAEQTLNQSVIAGNTIEGCDTSIEIIEGATENTIEDNTVDGDLVDANEACGTNTWQGGAVDCASTMPSSSPFPTTSAIPSSQPSMQPSLTPSTRPSSLPTAIASSAPSKQGSASPSVAPSAAPSMTSSAEPSLSPSSESSASPTVTEIAPEDDNDGGLNCLVEVVSMVGPVTFMFCLASDLWDIIWGLIQGIVRFLSGLTT